jgi:hypothetical protein
MNMQLTQLDYVKLESNTKRYRMNNIQLTFNEPSVNTDDFVKSAFKYGHSAMYLSGMSNQAVSDGGQPDGGGVAFFSSLPLGILHCGIDQL